MLFCCFYNRVQFQESVRSKFRPECARVFQFDFQFSNATFTVVVVRRNQRVFKKIAHILSVTDNSRVSLVTSVKRPPMVSYASNLFTVHKMLYCIIVKVKLAI